MKLYRIEQFINGEWQVLNEHTERVTINFALGFLEGLDSARNILTEKGITANDLNPKNFRVVDVESGSEYIDRR